MRKMCAMSIAAGLMWIGAAAMAAPPQANESGPHNEKKLETHKVQKPAHDHAHPDFKKAVAVMASTSGSDVHGVIELTQMDDGVKVTGKITGLEPGMHGFHIHEYGDLSDASGKAAGGHYNPGGHEHGGPDSKMHHAGDLGNVEANQDGVATVDKMAPGLKIAELLGRSIVVHGGKDDLKSQPSGAAGPRVGVAVIGLAEAK